MPTIQIKQLLITQSKTEEPVQSIRRRLAIKVSGSYEGLNETGSHYNVPITFTADGFDGLPPSPLFILLPPGRSAGETWFYLGIPIIKPETKEIRIMIKTMNEVLHETTISVESESPQPFNLYTHSHRI